MTLNGIKKKSYAKTKKIKQLQILLMQMPIILTRQQSQPYGNKYNLDFNNIFSKFTTTISHQL